MEDRRRNGFTLPELLVTLAVIALLAGVAVPSMARQLDKARLRAASAALIQELGAARSHAITHRKTVYFSINSDQRHSCFGWSDRAPCDCITGLGAHSCSTGDRDERRTHQQSLREFSPVQLDNSRGKLTTTLLFAGLRGTATATSFLLQSRYFRLKVVVSPLGRVRSCSPDGQGKPLC